MRDIFFTLFVVAGLIAALRAPYVGLMLWLLFSIMNPHQETWSLNTVPWNLIIALVTVGAWILSPEHKSPPRGTTTFLIVLLFCWTTFNTFFAFDPSTSWFFWNRFWKTLVMALFAGTITISMVRFHALMWIVALSLGFYGVKGGLFTLISGSAGGLHILGPPNSMISDNNTLAGALIMLLPIMNYLRIHSERREIRVGIVVSIVLIVTAILGSYSRGAYVGLAVLAITFWLRTKNKIVYPVLAIIIMIPLFYLMPELFYERAASIQDYNTDASVQGRFDLWWVAYRYAMDHFPFGAGFYGITLRGVWAPYMSGKLFAAHSIYFQVLGEQGVIGLVVYLLLIVSVFRNFQVIRRQTREVPEFRWAWDLATMMQLSLLAFCVCGAALALDFFDLLFLWATLSVSLRVITRREHAPLPVAVPDAQRLRPVTRPLVIPPT